MHRAILLLTLVAVANAATILQLAQSLPEFKTLVSVASRAGVAPLLNATGLKTVFAPTNDAFAALGKNTLAWITNERNRQHLVSTLYYHITPGALTTSLLRSGQQLPTLDEGTHPLTISGSAPNFNVEQAKITSADVIASNGVVQVINQVLVPSNIGLPRFDIVSTAAGVTELATLVKAVTAAGLVRALSQPNGPFTVFAPTDAAFAAVPPTVLQCLLSNPRALADVLRFHVVPGSFIYSEQIPLVSAVQTLAGKAVGIKVYGNTIFINFGVGVSTVVTPNVDTSNGVVHVVNTVLFDNTGPCAQS